MAVQHSIPRYALQTAASAVRLYFSPVVSIWRLRPRFANARALTIYLTSLLVFMLLLGLYAFIRSDAARAEEGIAIFALMILYGVSLLRFLNRMWVWSLMEIKVPELYAIFLWIRFLIVAALAAGIQYPQSLVASYGLLTIFESFWLIYLFPRRPHSFYGYLYELSTRAIVLLGAVGYLAGGVSRLAWLTIALVVFAIGEFPGQARWLSGYRLSRGDERAPNTAPAADGQGRR